LEPVFQAYFGSKKKTKNYICPAQRADEMGK
jgi:hypothetical protein